MVRVAAWRAARPTRLALVLSVVVVAVGAVVFLGGDRSQIPPSRPSAPSAATQADWVPAPGANLQWQWELDHPLSTTSDADLGIGDTTYTGASAGNPSVYDIDGFDNPASTVTALHALGAHVICYINVGAYENWRPDANEFPAALLGDSNGWPGEQWLDTNPNGPDYATLQAIMTARFKMCKDAGYDAVEPDNLDGSENTTGFTITRAEGDQYAEWVANEVHSLGMSVAQKNFVDQSSILEPYFDFVIDEQCFQYANCSDLAPYSAAGKAVLEVEYSDQGANPSSFCPTAITDGYSSVELATALDGSVRVPCAASGTTGATCGCPDLTAGSSVVTPAATPAVTTSTTAAAKVP